MTDLRVAFRHILRRPGMAALVAATLGLGIGVNTAIFSASWFALLQPPPYPASNELRLVHPVLITSGGADTLPAWSFPMYTAWRETAEDLGQTAAYTPNPLALNLETSTHPERVQVEFVSGTYFPLLGVLPAEGRVFTAAEDRAPGEAPYVVLSDAVWRRLFGGDRSVVGTTIRLNTIPLEIVGIAPAAFTGLSERADLFVPMMMAPTFTFPRRLVGSLSFWHAVIARLPGAPAPPTVAPRLARAADAVERMIPLREAFGDVSLEFAATPLAQARIHPSVRSALRLLSGAVACVLLIIVVNVTGVLLTRALSRRGEFGVRLAMGARPRDLARVVLAESILMGIAGGVAGMLVATWGLSLIRLVAPPLPAGTADLASASITPAVILFNFLLSLIVGTAVGIWPALAVARGGIGSTLQAASQRVAGSARGRGALVAVQIALALVLLTGAGLMLRSLQSLRQSDPGFRVQGLLTAGVTLPRQAYQGDAVPQFLDEALRRAAALPGVDAAAVANCLPLVGGCDQTRMVIAGREVDPEASVVVNMVDAGYFRTLDIPLVSGRPFAPSDRAGSPRVAILSRTAAERYWPAGGAVGARMRLAVGWDDEAEIVGIVEDIRSRAVDAPPESMVYLPYGQGTYAGNYLVLLTRGEPGATADPLRAAIRGIDAGIPLWDVQTMEARVGGSFAGTRSTTALLTIAAGLALFLAALGVFGVMAFIVAARTREFGLRMAMGARAIDVTGLMLRYGLGAAAAGVLLGLPASFLLARLLAPALRGVTPADPLAYAGSVVALLAAAGAAAWLPTRRATRIDPMEALRHE